MNLEIEMPFECAQWAHQPFQMSVNALLGPIGCVCVFEYMSRDHFLHASIQWEPTLH